MKEIALANGRGVALVDDEDYERLSAESWRLRLSGNSRYAVSGDGVLMHRMILETPAGMDTDHVDLNGLNNQRSNLRVATRSQNKANQPIRGARSGFKGVRRNHDGERPWMARIKVRGRTIYLGSFQTPEAAHDAYAAAAKEHFGVFARAV